MVRRYRGVLTLLAAVALGGLWYATADPVVDTTDVKASGTTAPTPSTPAPEVVTWQQAEAAGTTGDIDWGPRCDTETGQMALPGPNVPPCFAPFDGDNGGATSTGVTADTVTVVAYRPKPDDPMSAMASGVSGGATDAQAASKFQHGMVELMNRYYELYGRQVELVDFTGTGGASDAVAAVADAETIARDLRPFAVIGGPLQTNAIADTLAARQVICITCTPGQPDDFYTERHPYVWDLLKDPEQNGYAVNEYIGKRLAGRPARFAGDPAMHDTTRVFGSVHIELGSDTQAIGTVLEADLASYGVEPVVDASFTDPTQLAGTGRDIVTRLKEAGVTTVIYTGDPFAPGTLTKVATSQDYFPEWVITGTALIDTTVIPRLLYDQRQWAHAFGPANLFVRSTDVFSAADLYEWYFGETSPVPGTAASGSASSLQVLFLALEGMGADVTPRRFGDVLFGMAVIEGSPTLGQISFGDHGYFRNPDHTAVDDQAEVWWDTEAEVTDELGNQGRGAWRWVDGGRRVLPGEWPDTEPELFDRTNSVVTLDLPAQGTAYDPLR